MIPAIAWLLHSVVMIPAIAWLLHSVVMIPAIAWLLHSVIMIPAIAWLLHSVILLHSRGGGAIVLDCTAKIAKVKHIAKDMQLQQMIRVNKK